MKSTVLARMQLKEIVRQPLAWGVLFLLPLGLVAFLVYGLENLIKSETLLPPFDVAIVDEDNTIETKLLIQQFQEDEELEELITFRHVTSDEAEGLLANNEIASILKIPNGFTDGIRYGENKPVVVIGNEQRPIQSALFHEMMKSAADLVSAAQSGVNTIYEFLNRYDSAGSGEITASIEEFTLFAFGREKMFEKEEVESFSGVTPLNYYSTSGFILLLCLTGLLTMGVTMSSNARIDERLRTFGVSSSTQVSSHFFTHFAVLFLQSVILIGSFIYFTDLKITGELGWGLLSIVLTLAVISAWYSLLSSIPVQEGIRTFIGLLFLIVFAACGSLIFPEAYYTGILHWVNLGTWTHWVHTGLLHSIFDLKKELLYPSLMTMAAMTGFFLFTAYVLRQVKR
ncbi:ABC transporter permease [Alkalihalobacillus sp. AL-G]|uniref:ABC transporter permease n=1 Tax=Alkalihalobacillus sp. AL-G TaxID=2926399 RepID=UPI00272CEEFF|nr:ABC transporter permease [Alkalihalobacillus sp. AL-G]WLD93041.1 ABC transporter permease [Alkalihalobacillus sp. AL-G]